MWSCIWPPACSVVYCRGPEDLVPTLTAPEPLYSTHTQGQNRKRHTHSLHFSPMLWQDVTVCQPRNTKECVHAFVCVSVCELQSQMPSHDFSFVNTPLLLLPSSFPFNLCALSLWMTAWLQSPSPPQPNLSNLVSRSLA